MILSSSLPTHPSGAKGSPPEKAAAVERVLVGKEKRTAVAKDIGASAISIGLWVKKAKPASGDAESTTPEWVKEAKTLGSYKTLSKADVEAIKDKATDALSKWDGWNKKKVAKAATNKATEAAKGLCMTLAEFLKAAATE